MRTKCLIARNKISDSFTHDSNVCRLLYLRSIAPLRNLFKVWPFWRSSPLSDESSSDSLLQCLNALLLIPAALLFFDRVLTQTPYDSHVSFLNTSCHLVPCRFQLCFLASQLWPGRHLRYLYSIHYYSQPYPSMSYDLHYPLCINTY